MVYYLKLYVIFVLFVDRRLMKRPLLWDQMIQIQTLGILLTNLHHRVNTSLCASDNVTFNMKMV